MKQESKYLLLALKKFYLILPGKMILLSMVLFRRGKKCSFFLTSKERDSILVLRDCALRGNRDLTQRREMTKF